MRKIENDCCGCATPGYPCRGSDCPLTNVEHIYCDECGADITDEEYYVYDGMEICSECILEVLIADDVIAKKE